jgi:hypothetical protein
LGALGFRDELPGLVDPAVGDDAPGVHRKQGPDVGDVFGGEARDLAE